MERLFELIRFFEYENESPFSIEPERRVDAIYNYIASAVNLYSPSIVIKAGIGNPALLERIEPLVEGRLIVVDPSVHSIKKFLSRNPETGIDFICGEFNLFPVDYYSADLLINTDNLNYLESGRVIDEFVRILKFEGRLLMSAPVVDAEDFDGVYDELFRAASCLHNDYYMTVDLKTFLELNDLKYISGDELSFRVSIGEIKNHFSGFDPSTAEAVTDFLSENIMPLKGNYGYDTLAITEKWFCGVFMRKKPEPEQPFGTKE